MSERVSKPVENILPTTGNLLPSSTEEVEQELVLNDHLHDEDMPDILASALNNEQQQTENNLTSGNGKTLTTNSEFDSFVTIRTLLVLLSGILVRLSFVFSLGEQYVQVGSSDLVFDFYI